MNPEKVATFIRDLRKKEGLTQKDLALKYNVTYQAVSKWENGKNIPDIAILKQICEDYDMNLNDLLDGKKTNKKKTWLPFLIIFLFLILALIFVFLNLKNDKGNFEFKTLNATCKDFNLYGSIAYNKNKTAIYISNMSYCGENKEAKYAKISCKLYEHHDGLKEEIKSSLYEGKAITLDDYLKTITFNIDHYSNDCKMYLENALEVEIEAIKENNETIKYQIPLSLQDNCKL